jgi:hypothetical protein
MHVQLKEQQRQEEEAAAALAAAEARAAAQGEEALQQQQVAAEYEVAVPEEVAGHVGQVGVELTQPLSLVLLQWCCRALCHPFMCISMVHVGCCGTCCMCTPGQLTCPAT